MNAGYDSHPMNTGKADTGAAAWNKNDVFFSQLAEGLEGVSETRNLNDYGLIPLVIPKRALTIVILPVLSISKA